MKEFTQYSIQEIAQIISDGDFAIGGDGVTDPKAKKRLSALLKLVDAARVFVSVSSK